MEETTAPPVLNFANPVPVGGCWRNCTLTARLSYICISNRPKIHSFAKKWKTDGNFAKYGVQLQTADCHAIRQAKAFLCKNLNVVLVQKGGLRTANKASLHCKQGLFDTQMHLNCNAKKPSSHCKQGFFCNKSLFSPSQNARILAFTPKQNSWNGNFRCQNFLLHTQYLYRRSGVPARPPNYTKA